MVPQSESELAQLEFAWYSNPYHCHKRPRVPDATIQRFETHDITVSAEDILLLRFLERLDRNVWKLSANALEWKNWLDTLRVRS